MKQLCVVWFLGIFVAHAQTGPGGVGTNDGTSSLELWQDAHSGISSTGVLVDSWSDLSGNGILFGAAGTNRPDYVTAALNGRNYLNFDQTNFERLSVASGSLSLGLNASRSAFYVFEVTASVNNAELFGMTTGEMVDYGTFSTNNRCRVRNALASLNTLSGTGTVTYNTWNIGTTLYDGASTKAWNNASSIISQSNSAFGWAIDNSFRIGGTNTNGRSFTGNLSEFILFSHAVNTTERIIVENYLAAKYGLTLSATDIYDQDNVASGNYDTDVAGIGRTSVSDLHNDSQGTGIVRVLNATGLDDNEFLFWGHDNQVQQADEVVDVPPGISARLVRVWRATESDASGNAVDVGAVDMRWNLTGLGPVTASNLRLLVDTDNDGIFADETPISGAVSLGSNVYVFNGVTQLADNLRFTLATINLLQTPLPVTLIDYQAKAIQDKSELKWSTASETNSDHFTIERSSDTETTWKRLANLPAAENSVTPLAYTYVDDNPPVGISYYRLSQTDTDGQLRELGIRSVNHKFETIVLYPNPADELMVINGVNPEETAVQLFDLAGRELTIEDLVVSANTPQITISVKSLQSGMYWLRIAGIAYPFFRK